jgi:exodeoxyribonuclease VII small subunit
MTVPQPHRFESPASERSAAGPDASPPAAGTAPSAFEPSLAELESIVARMESGELSLEQSLAAYKRGAQLLHYCQAALKDAQQQVKILDAGLLQDFTGGAEQD